MKSLEIDSSLRGRSHRHVITTSCASTPRHGMMRRSLVMLKTMEDFSIGDRSDSSRGAATLLVVRFRRSVGDFVITSGNFHFAIGVSAMTKQNSIKVV